MSFPPVGLWPFAWFSFIPLLYLIDQVRTKRTAFGWAYLSGLIFFLAVLQWIHFVTTPGLILLAAYLALYFGVFGLFYFWSARFSSCVRLFLVPAGWVVLEFVRSTFLTGFNWGSLGHSQASVEYFVSLSAIAGVGGISYVVMAGNLIIKDFLSASRAQSNIGEALRLPAVFIACLLVICVICYRSAMAMTSPIPRITVAVVQPNISMADVRNPDMKPAIVHRQLDASRKVLSEKPDLIIWPETSFPYFIWDQPELFDEVKAFARDHRVPLLVGTVTHTGGQYFNSALLISAQGEVVQTHSKRHLVLFGEYIPFRKQLPFLAQIVPIDDFTPGSKDTIFELPNGVKFSVLVCFEDTLPELARRYVQEGAQFLVNMTNDAWFRDVGQQRMHLSNALFRSVENRRPLIRATNTGESCFMDSRGRVGRCVEDPAGRRVLVNGVAVAQIEPQTALTGYTKFGDIFTAICFLGILGMLTSTVIQRKREQV